MSNPSTVAGVAHVCLLVESGWILEARKFGGADWKTCPRVIPFQIASWWQALAFGEISKGPVFRRKMQDIAGWAKTLGSVCCFFSWWFHSFVRKPKLFGMIPNWSQAEELLRRALEGREKHLGPEHLDTLNSLLNLGDLLTHKRQFEEAKGNLWEPYGDKEGILQWRLVCFVGYKLDFVVVESCQVVDRVFFTGFVFKWISEALVPCAAQSRKSMRVTFHYRVVGYKKIIGQNTRLEWSPAINHKCRFGKHAGLTVWR